MAAPADPHDHGTRLRRISAASATAFLGAAYWTYASTGPVAAMLVLVAGVALNLVTGRVWALLPRALGGIRLIWASGYAASACWQAGVALTALAWAGEPWLDGPMAHAGPALMLVCALLLTAQLGPAFLRAWDTCPRSRTLLTGIAPAIVSAGAVSVLLSMSFRAGAPDYLRDVALSLLVFGTLLPGGIASLSLRGGTTGATPTPAQPTS